MMLQSRCPYSALTITFIYELLLSSLRTELKVQKVQGKRHETTRCNKGYVYQVKEDKISDLYDSIQITYYQKSLDASNKSFTCDLAEGNTFQNLSVSSPAPVTIV
jgi:hypothetical protein